MAGHRPRRAGRPRVPGPSSPRAVRHRRAPDPNAARFFGRALLLGCLGRVGGSAATAERPTRETGGFKRCWERNGRAHAPPAVTIHTPGALCRAADTVAAFEQVAADSVSPESTRRCEARLIAGRRGGCYTGGGRKFARHVEPDPSWFAAATSISLAVALLTVSAHRHRAARQEPAKALRYE